MNRIHFCIIIIISQLSLSISQSIPNHYFLYKSKKLLFDAGLNWETLTNFGPIRFKIEDKNQNLNHTSPIITSGKISLLNENTNFSMYGFSNFKYKDFFYAYIHCIGVIIYKFYFWAR